MGPAPFVEPWCTTDSKAVSAALASGAHRMGREPSAEELVRPGYPGARAVDAGLSPIRDAGHAVRSLCEELLADVAREDDAATGEPGAPAAVLACRLEADLVFGVPAERTTSGVGVAVDAAFDADAVWIARICTRTRHLAHRAGAAGRRRHRDDDRKHREKRRAPEKTSLRHPALLSTA